MAEPHPIYIYRDPNFASAGDTVVAAAPFDLVVNAYGAGGLMGEGGLNAAFGGAIVFRDDASGASFLGVWGKRNVVRFKATLKAHSPIEVIEAPPPARLRYFNKTPERPKRSRF